MLTTDPLTATREHLAAAQARFDAHLDTVGARQRDLLAAKKRAIAPERAQAIADAEHALEDERRRAKALEHEVRSARLAYLTAAVDDHEIQERAARARLTDAEARLAKAAAAHQVAWADYEAAGVAHAEVALPLANLRRQLAEAEAPRLQDLFAFGTDGRLTPEGMAEVLTHVKSDDGSGYEVAGVRLQGVALARRALLAHLEAGGDRSELRSRLLAGGDEDDAEDA